MAEAKILWIQGPRTLNPTFIPGLREKGYRVETVPTGKAALVYGPELEPDLVVVNAASLRTSGQRICSALRQALECPILLICTHQQTKSRKVDANQVLTLPFTLRKLLNRVRTLAPNQDGESLSAGPICLQLEDHILWVDDGDPQRLTPRLSSLLKTFLKHPGELLERKWLFRRVWKTDYVGDTRTLDVHIHLLRKVIEPDPDSPQRLKTVRGAGYRLEI
jgi:DNA-binding response OmpR family regulator